MLEQNLCLIKYKYNKKMNIFSVFCEYLLPFNNELCWCSVIDATDGGVI